jgi:hypothetical protein
MNIITYQHELRPVLDTVFGAKEYREFRETLEEMDRILEGSGVEHRILTQKINNGGTHLSIQRQKSLYRRYRQALRSCLLLGLTGLSFRELSLRVADSHLFQWFTYTDSLGPLIKKRHRAL